MEHNDDVVSAWGVEEREREKEKERGCLWHPTSDKGESSLHYISMDSS